MHNIARCMIGFGYVPVQSLPSCASVQLHALLLQSFK